MKSWLIFIILLLCFSFPFLAESSTPAIYKSAEPIWVTHSVASQAKPGTEEIKDGYLLNQIEDQVHIEKKAHYHRTILQIMMGEGVKNASDISVSFDPSFEKLLFHQIIVWRNGKPRDFLKVGDFKVTTEEKECSRLAYNGKYTAQLKLKDVRKGDKIEYSYTIEGRSPVFGDHYAKIFDLQGYRPVSHRYISLIASTTRNLRFQYFNGAKKPTLATQGQLTKYEWDVVNLKVLHYEENEPDWYTESPYFQISDYQNWLEVINWLEKNNPISVNLKGRLGNIIARFRKEQSGEETLFREAARYVQNGIRYIDVENSSYSYRSNDAEQVLSQRYGDSKDKSILLVSLLRGLGIEASLAFVDTYEAERIDGLLPSPFHFDHTVVVARIKGKSIWVDPTLTYQGGTGTELYFPEYGKALVVDKNNNKLTTIPKSESGKVVCQEFYMSTNSSNPVKLNVKTVYTLKEADRIRRWLSSSTPKEREKQYIKYYSYTYPKIKATDTLIIRDDIKKNELTLIENYQIHHFFKKDSVLKNFSADFYADYISDEFPPIEDGRKNPISLKYPLNIDYTIKMLSPGGWNIETESSEIKRDGFIFNSDYFADEDILTLHYQFRYLKSYISKEKIGEFASDIDVMKSNYLHFNVVYTPEEVPFYPNYWLIVSSIVLLLVFSYIGYIIYHQESKPLRSQKIGIRIGGWLILVCLGLLVSSYYSIYNIYENEYLDLNNWKSYSSMSFYLFHQIDVVSGLFTSIYITCFSVFCLILLLKRRDILPQLILIYYASSSILLFVNYILDSMVYGKGTSIDNVVYSVISTFICIMYFKNSERVKETFVVSYRKR